MINFTPISTKHERQDSIKRLERIICLEDHQGTWINSADGHGIYYVPTQADKEGARSTVEGLR